MLCDEKAREVFEWCKRLGREQPVSVQKRIQMREVLLQSEEFLERVSFPRRWAEGCSKAQVEG